jgi:stearoyl-CoA desaturase (Delta-9 desaturase)
MYKYNLILFFSIFHLLALFGIYQLFIHKNIIMFIDMFLWYLLSGILGITIGAHRLWSHTSFIASYPVKILCMMANNIANQGSILWWARDHKVHHKNVDTDGDPYNINRGFFFAHMGWIFMDKHEKVIKDGKLMDMSHLLNDSVVMFQYKYDPYFRLLCCFVIPTLYGYYMYSPFLSLFNSFLIFGALRRIITMHSTWCINSVSHTYGYRPYNNKIEARNNIFTTMLTGGEGYHNYHHVYPYDYRGDEGVEFNPINISTIIIDLFIKLGLASNPKVGILNKTDKID